MLRVLVVLVPLLLVPSPAKKRSLRWRTSTSCTIWLSTPIVLSGQIIQTSFSITGARHNQFGNPRKCVYLTERKTTQVQELWGSDFVHVEDADFNGLAGNANALQTQNIALLSTKLQSSKLAYYWTI